MGEPNSDVRMFVAVETPGAIRRKMELAQLCLEPIAKDLKWIPPENIHLTLKFLGDVEEGRIPRILDTVREVARETHAFRLSTEQVEGAPRSDQARVVWLGIGGETEILSRLQRRLEDEAEQMGIQREKRKFYPHITFARSRRRPVHLPDEVSDLANPVHFMVQRLVVFRSQLRPEGAVYTPLGYSPLSPRVPATAH
jgi:2'-5' RNA ligase